MANIEWPSHQLMPPIRDNDHQQGSDEAMILLMEYGDYPCPNSAEAYITVQDMQGQLGQQLCFIYRHFPSSPRSSSWKASEAAEAAGAQGKFWEMHDQLYTHADSLEDCHLVQYADHLHLDIPKFLKEMNGHTHQSRIQEDFNSGRDIGVMQTPTFFISIRHQGHQKLAQLLQNILEVFPPISSDV